MTVTDRRRSILEIGVRDFIETGRPITSGRLFDVYDFGIKPAMIRWELNSLGKEGYFYQNHPSGGRVPTDKAYRFFIRCAAMDFEDVAYETPSFFDFLLDGEMDSFVREVSSELGVLGLCYETETRSVYNSGFGELFAGLDFESKDDVMDVFEDFDRVLDRLSQKRDWWEEETSWPKFFVGRNFFTKSDRLSVVMSKVGYGGGEDVMVLAVGPKRMDYEKSWSMFKGLSRLS